MNNSVQSWYDFPVQEPTDVRVLVANAFMAGVQGVFSRSTNFVGALTWAASPFTVNANPTCLSLHNDDILTVNNAAQWNFDHQTANTTATNPPPLRKVLFLRGGTEWEMQIGLSLGAQTYSDLQLSFRDNAATPGNFSSGGTGTIPVILFPSALTGSTTLKVSLKMFGTFIMAISARDGLGTSSMFEMEWIVVP